MTRTELAHVIRAVATHTGLRDVVVIGSQAILGTAHENDVPDVATRSIEADIAIDPASVPGEAAQIGVDATAIADEIDGAFGELSPFHAAFGYYAQGVEVATAILPDGWRGRLRPLVVDLRDGSTAVGWCLDVHDLWLSKAAAGREKDVEFCCALVAAGWIDRDAVATRVATLGPVHRRRVEDVIARAFDC